MFLEMFLENVYVCVLVCFKRLSKTNRNLFVFFTDFFV